MALGSWLSSAFHAVAGSPVVDVAANVVAPGSGALLAAANTIGQGGGSSSSSAPVQPAVTTTAVNPQGELILGGLALLAIVLLSRHPAVAPATAVKKA